jgi:hypothetical protein
VRISEITKVNLSPTFGADLTDKRLPSGTELTTYKNIKILWDKKPAYIAILGTTVDTETNVFAIILQRYGNVYEVDSTIIDRKFQGFGIMADIYAEILKKIPDNIVIRAGSLQTSGGSSIWKRLAQRDDIIVFTKHGKNFVELEYDPDADDFVADELGDWSVYDAERATMYAVANQKNVV